MEKGKQVSESYGRNLVAIVSAPICRSSISYMNPNMTSKEALELEKTMMGEEKKAINQLVQWSLQNMKIIVKRAKFP